MHDITIGKLGDRYTVQWMEGGRRRRFRLNAKTKIEAKAEGLKVYNSKQVLDQDNLTVKDLWERYHTHLKGRVTAGHLTNAWRVIGPFFGQTHPLDVTDELVAEYIFHRRSSFKELRGREISTGTLRSEINYLNCALNYGYKRGLIQRPIFLTKPSSPVPRDRWLTEDEIALLFAEAQSTPHIYLAIALMLGTAGRVTAVLQLTWDRVDLENRAIDLRIDPAQPAKGRARVPMNDGLFELLSKWKNLSECNTVVSYRDKPIKSIKKSFGRIARAAGLKGVSPHVLRHTAAVHMVAQGCDMERVSQYLGHSNVSVTRRVYARFAPEHLQKEAKAVDFLGKVSKKYKRKNPE